MPPPPVRALHDWHPDNPRGLAEAEWLAGWAKSGWVPEWLPPYGGSWCDVGGIGRRRWAMVRTVPL